MEHLFDFNLFTGVESFLIANQISKRDEQWSGHGVAKPSNKMSTVYSSFSPQVMHVSHTRFPNDLQLICVRFLMCAFVCFCSPLVSIMHLLKLLGGENTKLSDPGFQGKYG